MAALTADTVETRYRAWAQNRYALRTEDAAVLPLPLAQADLAYIQAHAAALRWEFITRNYSLVIQYIGLHGNGVWVTIIYCTLAVLTAIIVNPLCAYALSRYNLSYANMLLLFVLATMAFPAEVSMIPNFLLLKQLNLLNTFWALILPGAANGFSIFLLKGFFDSLPKELYEAGTLDGASELRMFTPHHAAPVQAHLRRDRAGRVHRGLWGVHVRADHLPEPQHVDHDGLAVRDAGQRRPPICHDGRPDAGRHPDPPGLFVRAKYDHEGYHFAELQVAMMNPDDPQFDALRRERQAQYGVSIAYVKRLVGTGTEYANEIARAVLSSSGGYFELAEMPEEFAGALGGGVSHRLVAPSEALDLTRRLERLAVAVAEQAVSPRALSFYVLYAGGSLRTRREMFVLDHKHGDPLFAHGGFQQGIVPRFLKVRFDPGADAAACASYGLAPGVQFLLTPSHLDTGRCLLGAFTRTPHQADLSSRPTSTMMN